MTGRIWPSAFRAARLAGLLAFCALVAFGVQTQARAQETPEPTSAPTAAPGETTVGIQLSTPEEPVPVGDIIEATVTVNNVSHLAGFDFTITYDKDKLRLLEAESGGTPVPTADPSLGGVAAPLVQVDQLGAILASSPRGADNRLICQVPSAGEGVITVNCNTAFEPFCLGGPEGASGSGTLAVIPFESRGGGVTSVEITSSTLVLDDLEPCDFETGAPVPIPHTRGAAATVELAPKDSSNTMLIIIIVVVVVVVVAAAGGGFYAYRRTQGAGQ